MTFFFFFNSTSCLADAFDKANSGGHSATPYCLTSALGPYPSPHFPKNAFLLQMTGFQPCLYPTDAGGGQGSVRLQPVTEGWECGGKGGRDTECTGRLVGQNAAAGSTAAQGSGQARKCFVPSLVSSSIPGRLEPSPATQHRNVLCAALAHGKIELR